MNKSLNAAKRVHVRPSLAGLYEKDETAWLDKTAALIRRRRLGELDFQHLAQFLTDMARRHRREVESRLLLILTHMLKWDDQAARRSSSWRTTLRVQRHALQRLLDRQTLRNHAAEVLASLYADARRNAIDETGLPEADFLASCPYSLEEILIREEEP